MGIIFRALRFSEKTHITDIRQNTGEPYIIHPIATIISILKESPHAYSQDIIVMILHDALEDHPSCWWDILAEFDIQTFRDVLILSKISYDIRREILQFFSHNADLDNPIIIEILQILSPRDPIDKITQC
jgi:(p)ppGpp synthase/HD superfamily hydrolase